MLSKHFSKIFITCVVIISSLFVGICHLYVAPYHMCGLEDHTVLSNLILRSTRWMNWNLVRGMLLKQDLNTMGTRLFPRSQNETNVPETSNVAKFHVPGLEDQTPFAICFTCDHCPLLLLLLYALSCSALCP
jgi:hypothetical protein